MSNLILIVDDDPTQRRLLEAVANRQGYRTRAMAGGRAALDYLRDPKAEPIDLVLLDLVMPDVDGWGVLEQMRPLHPNLPVIVLTGQAGVDTVVRAMRAGANDFVVKPVSPERLMVSIENALTIGTLAGQVARLSRKVAGEVGFRDMIAGSAGMRQVLDLARRASASTIPILIEGESGVGKELVARTIQGSGERKGKPFVVVNCGAIPENLVESILFGHEKGAFTGAVEKHAGKFVEASGGTLFLDEIGELRRDMQVKLLRALQQGEVDPVGGKGAVKVDIRLISATNRDLSQMVQQGKFREDLYYRLNVFPIHVLPLRERREDIPALVDHFISVFAASEGRKVRGVASAALDLLVGYAWPGNVRQLENAVFRAVVLSDGELLQPEDFPQILQSMGGVIPPRVALDDAGALPPLATAPLPIASAAGAQSLALADMIRAVDENGAMRTLADVEAEMIRLSIEKYHGQMSEVSRRLGIGRSTLYRKVRDLGIPFREDG
jgi:DNA-binding NtrC family response regulator